MSHSVTRKANMKLQQECEECGRVFDLTDEDDANEFYYGHDCEA